jgi:DNA-directed RNA polymerase subunit F
MIINKKPLSLAEAKCYLGQGECKKPVESYLKTFIRISEEKAEKLAEEMRALNNLKIKEENIMKVVDFLPRDSEDVNKIFNEVNLTEDETNAILGIVKKY